MVPLGLVAPEREEEKKSLPTGLVKRPSGGGHCRRCHRRRHCLFLDVASRQSEDETAARRRRHVDKGKVERELDAVC